MEEVGNSLTPVRADVRHEWHWVGPIVAELLKDNPDVQAIPEDIYADCRAGNAHLWVSPSYMLITEFEVTEYSGERVSASHTRGPESRAISGAKR